MNAPSSITYTVIDHRVPQKGDWYINKLGEVVRQKSAVHSRRAQARQIVSVLDSSAPVSVQVPADPPTVTEVPCLAYEITGIPRLDPIRVFWQDVGAGKGFVTLTCWGQAWTAYFNGLGDRTIRQFFREVDSDYLADKLGITPLLKCRKADLAYLRRIIEAVQATLEKT